MSVCTIVLFSSFGLVNCRAVTYNKTVSFWPSTSNPYLLWDPREGTTKNNFQKNVNELLILVDNCYCLKITSVKLKRTDSNCEFNLCYEQSLVCDLSLAHSVPSYTEGKWVMEWSFSTELCFKRWTGMLIHF